MIVRNNETKKEYPLSKAKWDALGKHQKIFTIVNAEDNHQVSQKIVSNLSKGEKPVVKEEKKVEEKKTGNQKHDNSKTDK